MFFFTKAILRSRPFVSLAFFLTSSLANAAKLPSELVNNLFKLCSQTVAWYGGHEVDTDQFVTGIIQYMEGRFPNVAKEDEKFRRVLRDYIRRERSKGRPAPVVLHELELTQDWYLTKTATADELDVHFRRNVSEMNSLRIVAARQNNRFTFSDLGVTTPPELTRLVSDFERTGVTLNLVDMPTMLAIGLTPYAVCFHRDNPHTWRHQSPIYASPQDPIRRGLLTIGGMLALWPTELPQGRTLPAGIYLADYYNPPGLPDQVVHEMAHVVQDLEWDLDKLLQIYDREIRQPLNARPGAPTLRKQLNHFFELIYPVSRHNFETATLRPEARAQLLRKGDDDKMEAADWVLFLYMQTLLAELDAHLKQGMMASHRGFPVSHLTREHVFAHIKEAYIGRGKVVHPVAADFIPLNKLFEMLDEVTKKD